MTNMQPGFDPTPYHAGHYEAVKSMQQDISNHGGASEFLVAKRKLLYMSEAYRAHRTRMDTLAGYAFALYDIKNDHQVIKSSMTLVDGSFDDGIAFGMLASHRLMATPSEQVNNIMTRLMLLDPHMKTITDDFETITKNGGNLDHEVGKIGMRLYNNSLAHPDDPNSMHANRATNQLAFFAGVFSKQLYTDSQSSHDKKLSEKEFDEVYDRSKRFLEGFGYQRRAHNAHKLQTEQETLHLFDDSITTDNSN